MSSTDVTETPQSENELITRAQSAVSTCNWVVGECAAEWTQRYSRGRTDADFGVLVGMSGDQVYQRRRVWETFGDVSGEYPGLRWSHFYVALNWDDAPECLQWAQENDATVAEMKAWRRAMRGEDLTAEPEGEDEGFEAGISFVPTEPTVVRDADQAPGNGGGGEGSAAGGSGRSGEMVSDTVPAFARESESPGMATQAPAADQSGPSVEQMIKRMTGTLERINKALTPDVLEQFSALPAKSRQRFVSALSDLNSTVAPLM